MGEPQAGQRLGLRRARRGEPGKIAVDKRHHHDVARRLAEIDRLDDVVERRGGCLQKMHSALLGERLGYGVAVETFEADDHDTALAHLRGAPRPVSYTHLRAHETDSYLV